MEVHHHTHTEDPATGHTGKKFKHYIFEFFMLFLAVFCGFLAENFREHYVERYREKEYLMSLLDGLKYDTMQCNSGIRKTATFRPLLDSAYNNVKKVALYNYKLMAKWNTPINATGLDFIPMMPIIEQLKSSGNLRLIESRPIVNKIMEYEAYIHSVFQNSYDGVQKAKGKIYDLEDELCDYDEFSTQLDNNMNLLSGDTSTENSKFYDMPVIIKDPAKLNLLANSFINLKAWNWAYSITMNEAKRIATELIQMINSKYHLI